MRSLILCLALFAAAAPAAAQQQQDPATPPAVQQVYACAAIADDAARLACYDSAVGRMQEAQTRGDLVAVDRVQAEEIGRDSFGLQIPSVTRILGMGEDGGVQEVTLQVAEVRVRLDGKAVITMTNGQRWEQIDGEAPRRLRVGDEVTVRRASFGSYMMSLPNGGRALRVRRQA